MSRDITHPVWDVYDLYRTARLNIKYFACKLTDLKTLNFWMEFILAITASSAVVTFAIWKTPAGSMLWQTLSFASAILAVAKPLLNLTEKITKVEEVLTAFRILEHDLKLLEISIRQRRAYDKDLPEKFISAFERMKGLIEKYSENKENKKRKTRLQGEVLKELPASNFFVPDV
jgi:hypothetical protein